VRVEIPPETINLFVGFDPKESVAAYTFIHSVQARTEAHVNYHLLTPNHTKRYGLDNKDGTKSFTYLRFLVPWMMGFRAGEWGIWADGDMVCLADILELWRLRTYTKAVQVVKHDYKTQFPVKFNGEPNRDYERKNWSSVVLFNCNHVGNRCLTPEYVRNHDGAHLHRFSWLQDYQIGEIPREWNHIPLELKPNPEAKLVHYSIGTPCYSEYANCEYAGEWHHERHESQRPCVL
jgi:lipopolysaccharide biosynthesis glycosyltransferase